MVLFKKALELFGVTRLRSHFDFLSYRYIIKAIELLLLIGAILLII